MLFLWRLLFHRLLTVNHCYSLLLATTTTTIAIGIVTLWPHPAGAAPYVVKQGDPTAVERSATTSSSSTAATEWHHAEWATDCASMRHEFLEAVQSMEMAKQLMGRHLSTFDLKQGDLLTLEYALLCNARRGDTPLEDQTPMKFYMPVGGGDYIYVLNGDVEIYRENLGKAKSHLFHIVPQVANTYQRFRLHSNSPPRSAAFQQLMFGDGWLAVIHRNGAEARASFPGAIQHHQLRPWAGQHDGGGHFAAVVRTDPLNSTSVASVEFLYTRVEVEKSQCGMTLQYDPAAPLNTPAVVTQYYGFPKSNIQMYMSTTQGRVIQFHDDDDDANNTNNDNDDNGGSNDGGGAGGQ